MNIIKCNWPVACVLKIAGCLILSALEAFVAFAQAPALKPVPPAVATENSMSTSNRNMYRTGGSVRLASPVKGDFYAAGGRVTIEQTVAGDATLAGGSVDVRASIGDDLRAAGGDINIESSIGGELYAFGGNIALRSTATVADSVTLYAGNITIEGKLKGPLKVYAQKVVLNGEVAKDVELNAQEIELGSMARLSGALRYPSNAQFKTAEGAVIGGSITRGDAMNGRPDTHRDREWHGQMMGTGSSWPGIVASTAASFFGMLAAFALFLLVFTGFSTRASNRISTTPGAALAAGLAIFLGTPMLAMLLFITLIGIPLALALMMLFPVLLFIGCLVGIFALAQRLQRVIQKTPGSSSRSAVIGFFALALLLVLLIGSLPIVGSLTVVVLVLLGTGACALELYQQLQAGRNSSKGAGVVSDSSLPTVSSI
jgi:cytoskeletal protein CcmA (bactofilin family)